MAQAMAMVKAHMGDDAMILHTRSFKQGGFLGFGAQNVIEVTATTPDERPRRRKAPRRERPPLNTPTRPPLVGPSNSQPTAGDLIRRTYAAALSEQQNAQPHPSQSTYNNPHQPLNPQQNVITPPPVHPASHRPNPAQPQYLPASNKASNNTESAKQLAEEMQAVKRMVERLMQQQASRGDNKPSDLPDQLFDQYMNLIKQEVAQEIAQDIVTQVSERLTEKELENPTKVRKAIRDCICDFIPAHHEQWDLEKTEDGRPRTIALIGPTGVGKTTTVAKLAATFKLKQAKHVGLITLDTYRIAAVDQLRTYADIIGIPLHVCNTAAELDAAVGKCAGCDVVLIDTAGRSQRDDPKLDQLKKFIDTANPHEVHLVLSSTCTQKVMLEAAKRFSEVRTDRIIFTKLDEAVSYGVLLNVSKQVGKELSYITTGQEVPHQIEPTASLRLADLVIDGELAS
ncbi:MAG: flagellar biosynthesis protein FlhF [Phycisphaeraceae bacterium]|nr:flagellar biosynthesis protein FlhF [Phycisphaeraceae bacterium]